ncbi:MAG: glycosyltransferase 61 family protein [Desulfovibrio sp.]
MIEVPSLEELLADKSGRDLSWTWLPPSKGVLDPDRLRSNVPMRCFRTRVLHGTQGAIVLPGCKVFRYNRLRMTPLVPHAQKYPEWVRIHDSQGRPVREILPRITQDALQPREYHDPVVRSGRYVYLGFVIMHYGHLLTEFLSRMWFDPSVFDPDTRFLVQAREEHQNWWREGVGFSRNIMEMICRAFGVPTDRVEFVDREAEYETVFAPTPLNAYPLASRPEVSALYERLADHVLQRYPKDDVPGVGKQLFLSRSGLSGERRTYYNGVEVDRIFADLGYSVVHPQRHSFPAQVRMFRRARIVAGEEGSALCGAMFAKRPEVVYLESGRFHSNLPNMLYHHARRMHYVVAHENWERIAPASLFSKLYVPRSTLVRALSDIPGGASTESICISDTDRGYLRMFEAAQRGDILCCADELARLIQSSPKSFQPDVLPALMQNLREAKVPEQQFAQFAKFAREVLHLHAGLRTASAAPTVH